METSLIFGILGTVFSVTAIALNIKSEIKQRKVKLMYFLLEINKITIKYPELRVIYKRSEELEKIDSITKARLRGLCYTFLNMLELVDIHYKIFNGEFNDQKLEKELNKKTNSASWLNYYSRTFKKGKVGNEIMLDILNNCNNSGDYSKDFSEFAIHLLNFHPN